MTNGSQANHNGARFEFLIEITLQEYGYTKSSNGKELFKHRDQIQGKYYARQVPVGPTAFGGKSRRIVDFCLVNKEAFSKPPLLEAKWQQVAGSTDRILASTVNDIRETFKREGTPTIIIYGGPGFSADKIAWLKKQVSDSGLLAVWSMEEFQAAVNNGFLTTGEIKLNRTRPTQSRNPLYKNGGLFEGLEGEEES